MLYEYTRPIHGDKYPIANDIHLKSWRYTSQGPQTYIPIRGYKEGKYKGYQINLVYPENHERARKFVVHNKGKPGYKDFLKNLNSNYARNQDPMFSFEGIMIMGNSRLHL